MGENIYFIVSISLYHFYMAVIGLLSRQFTIFRFLCNNNEPSIGRTSRKMAMYERTSGCRKASPVQRNYSSEQEQMQASSPNGLQVW